MAKSRRLQWAFAGGEMSPELFGHTEDIGYQTGVARMRNFIATPRGPARRRPGLERVAACYKAANTKARLITFNHTSANAFAMEVGYDTSILGYMRFHQSGAPITFTPNTAATDPMTWPIRAFVPKQSCRIYSQGSSDAASFHIQDHSILDTAFTAHANHNFNVPAHGYVTGDPVGVVSNPSGIYTGAYPGTPALSSATVYYIIKLDNDNFRLADTYANAIATTHLTTLTITGSLPWQIRIARADYVATGDAIRLLPDTLPTALPAPLSSTTTYYAGSDGSSIGYNIYHTRQGAIDSDPNDIVLLAAALAYQGTFFDVSLSGGFRRRYRHGELVEQARYSLTFYTVATEHSGETFSAGNFLAQESDNIYTIRSPYAAADIFSVNYTQSKDVMTLVCPTYTQRELRRYSATWWELVSVSLSADVRPPENVVGTGTAGRVFDLHASTAVSVTGPPARIQFANFGAGTSQSHFQVAKGDYVLIKGLSARGIDDGTYAVERVDVGGQNDFEICNVDSTAVTAGSTGAGSSPTARVIPLSSESSNSYQVTAVDSNGHESLPSSTVTVADNNLFVTGSYNTITWDVVSAAAEYRIYKEQSGIFGYIGNTAATATLSFKDDNIAPDMGVTPPIQDSSLGGTENAGAVGYYQQRRVFARTSTYPHGVWMTVAGTESDMLYHLPTQDSDRIKFSVASRETEIIRHVVSMEHLLLFTDQTEYRVSPLNSDILTPSTIGVSPQSHVGSNTVRPVIVDKSILFAANRGGHVYEVSFQLQADGFVPNDVSMRAAHLFDGYTLSDAALMKAPHQIAWWISSSGYLLGFTYSAQHQIGAWHWHDTTGTFESCCVVPEGDEDRLYVIVNRSGTRSVQRMGSMEYATLDDGYFVDDGVYNKSGTTITGLTHLNGLTVQILADGVVQATQVVSGGQVTLAASATEAHVGLGYTSEIHTMPFINQIEASSHGRTKNISKVSVRVYESGPFQVGPNTTDVRNSDPYGETAGALTTDEIMVPILGQWTDDGQVVIMQTNPLPLTVVSVVVTAAIGGD